jgi:glutathionylspermidine synthase
MAKANWIEPSWKMILSNKAIMAVLWQLYPNHPLLLETYFEEPKGMEDYVKKPLLSREGANVTLYKGGKIVEASPGNMVMKAIFASSWHLCIKKKADMR